MIVPEGYREGGPDMPLTYGIFTTRTARTTRGREMSCPICKKSASILKSVALTVTAREPFPVTGIGKHVS